MKGETRWTIADELAIRVPSLSYMHPHYLPDPRGGSLYTNRNPRSKDSRSSLTRSAPCRSSDGILYPGKKRSDDRFLIDLKTSRREKVLGFGTPLDGDKTESIRWATWRAVYLGRTQYTVMMCDSQAIGRNSKPWNVTYFDYTSHVTVPIKAKPVPVDVPAPKCVPTAVAEPSKDECSPAGTGFRTAKDELQIQNVKKYGTANPPGGKTPLFAYGGKKSLGGRRTLGSKFVCPIRNDDEENKPPSRQQTADHQAAEDGSSQEEVDERLRHIDPKMVELIRNEIMDRFSPVTWDDIAGLEYAKQIIREAIVCPLLRPDIFTGLRKPPRGILLFGPPGTGKTLIGKCIASQSNATFFSISASSLTSKWIGEGEKMVRTLFAVAAVHQPAVVFIDEIDSLLCQRSETEHESSRRLKTEFLIQLDGAATGDDERILIVGATNRPQELDEAARRRLVKRLYIPLPELNARAEILRRLLANEKNSLTDAQIAEIGQLTEGFSGADMKVLCHEASMGPIRSISYDQLVQVSKDDVRAVNYEDFRTALGRVRASVSPGDLVQYVQWDRLYGSGSSG